MNPSAASLPPQRSRRRMVAIWICLGGLILSAGAGWYFDKQYYTSLGVIQIVKPAPIAGAAAGGAIPMYELFLASQLVLLKSSRVMEAAIEKMAQSEALRDRWAGDLEISEGTLAKQLEIAQDGGTFRVSFPSRDPKLAREATFAVIDTYA